jgi:hypothetical protein
MSDTQRGGQGSLDVFASQVLDSLLSSDRSRSARRSGAEAPRGVRSLQNLDAPWSCLSAGRRWKGRTSSTVEGKAWGKGSISRAQPWALERAPISCPRAGPVRPEMPFSQHFRRFLNVPRFYFRATRRLVFLQEPRNGHKFSDVRGQTRMSTGLLWVRRN